MKRVWAGLSMGLLVAACGGGDALVSRPTWQPPSGATPASGTYVYIESESTDTIGQGRTTTYTQTNSTILMSTSGARLSFEVQGAQNWNADFLASDGDGIVVGFWGDLSIYPPPRPDDGGLHFRGDGRQCTVVSGWFVVDRIGFDAQGLSLIELRFQQRCDGNTSVLRGKIRVELR
jgi:hypothetical protein